MTRLRVRRLTEANRADFYTVHSERHGLGWCNCVAWWCDTWEEFGKRTATQNRAQREALLDAGEHDGYLLYLDGEPVGWCQCGPRDRLRKLCRQYDLQPAPDTWAVTCFAIAPAHRRQGRASELLRQVLEDLGDRGVVHVQAFPVRQADDPWTGPESLYVNAGFSLEGGDARHPVYGLRLG
jgi:ribosomal protein S18 acetylase RimI-like enzyme